MEKSKLFSIGEFSQLTGVTIKALHYYEKINILKPMFIDEASGYRYYDISQLALVEAIELLHDLDIRLNQLPDFTSEDSSSINYDKILIHGKSLICDQIQDLETKMKYIDYLEETKCRTRFTNENYPYLPLWLMSYDKSTSGLSTTEVLKIILENIRPYELSFRHTYGRIMFCNGKDHRIYYFIDLKLSSEKRVLHENIFYLPDGKYRTLQRENSKLEDAKHLFKDLFAIPYDKIVIETEDIICCLLPDK